VTPKPRDMLFIPHTLRYLACNQHAHPRGIHVTSYVHKLIETFCGARHTMSAEAESPCTAIFVPPGEMYMLGLPCLSALQAVHQKRVQCRRRGGSPLEDSAVPSALATGTSESIPRHKWLFDQFIGESCDYLTRCKAARKQGQPQCRSSPVLRPVPK
jgi:hypothetical protein